MLAVGLAEAGLVGRVGLEQSFRDSHLEREAKRRHRFRDRAVAQPAGQSRPGNQPIDEVLERDPVEIAHADLAVEVGQCEGEKQPSVLAARARAHAVMSRAGVGIEPGEAERVQRRSAPPRAS